MSGHTFLRSKGSGGVPRDGGALLHCSLCVCAGACALFSLGWGQGIREIGSFGCFWVLRREEMSFHREALQDAHLLHVQGRPIVWSRLLC